MAVSETEKKQENQAALEAAIARVEISEMQMDIFHKLQDKYRLVDGLDAIAQKGFNQQLKSAINSAIARQKTFYTDCDRVKNDRGKNQASLNLDELERMVRFLR